MLRIVKALPTTLKAPLTAAGLTITLQELHDSKDNEIPMSAFGDEGVVVLKQGDVTEMIKFTGVTHNSDGSATLTVPASGRDILPIYPYTSSATGEDFNAGAVAIISNDPYTLWKITEDYANGLSYNGSPDSSTTVKGIVEEATQAEIDADTAAGSTSARLFVNPSTLATSKYGTRLPSADQIAALAGTPGTPSTTNKFVTENMSLTAGETINGGTLPVPVYQNKTDNKFYACDGNDTAKMKFVGFAVSNGTNGNALLVQFSGIVDGFTNLDEGEKYYLSDTEGTIATTPGTYQVLVGVAISTTQLLIQKGVFRASGYGSFSDVGNANAQQTAVITCGFRPSVVRFHAYSGNYVMVTSGVYLNGVSYGAHVGSSGANGSANNISGAVGRLETPSTQHWTFTITDVTDTSFTIAATQNDNSPSVAYYHYEVEGHL